MNNATYGQIEVSKLCIRISQYKNNLNTNIYSSDLNIRFKNEMYSKIAFLKISKVQSGTMSLILDNNLGNKSLFSFMYSCLSLDT